MKSCIALVGTYTGGKGKGIYSFRFDADTGDLQLLGSPVETANPSYLVVSPDEKFVYAVNELHGDNHGAVSAFRFDRKSGAMTFLSRQTSAGDDPCHLSLSADGRNLFVANYGSGSLSVLPIEKDGSLAPPVQTLAHTGKGPNAERQKSAHAHMVLSSPDNAFLFATDLGADRVYIYDYIADNDERPLRPADPPYAQLTPGSGPRHFAFSQDGRFVYVIEEMGEAVVVFSRHGARMDPVQTVRVAEKDWPGDCGAAALHLSADGKFLYASNRANANELIVYSVDAKAGTLTSVGRQASLGKTPREFCIDPTGRFLLVANQDSDNIVIFERDPQTGTLLPTGKSVDVGSPACVAMILSL